jgi:AraC-like DNA-binding protein
MFELTDEGFKLVPKVYEQHKKDIEAVLGILTIHQRKQLYELLKKIGIQADRLQHERSKNKKTGLAPWQLRRATEYISEHLAHPARMKEIAELTGLSESQFGRAFKLSMGISPHQWQIRMRIVEAQELLKEGKLSLAEIAIATGFTEQSHFTRVFKELVGVSPGIWQRKNRA